MSTRATHTYHASTDIDPYAKELIRHKIRRLVLSGGITHHDGEDLAQQLALHAHLAAERYDSSRGTRSTFFTVILTRRLASLLAARRAQKRDRRRELSIELLPEDDLAYDPWPQLDLARDLSEALASLPEDLRRLATQLEEMKQADVVRTTGLTRHRVRGRQLCIARHLRSHGITKQNVLATTNLRPSRVNNK